MRGKMEEEKKSKGPEDEGELDILPWEEYTPLRRPVPRMGLGPNIPKMSVGRYTPPDSNVRKGPEDMMQTTDNDSHVSIPIQLWITSLEEKLVLKPKLLRDSSGNPSCCIHRVPRCLRQNHKDKDYIPQIISIGPFHRGKKSLRAMEEHKWKYLHDIVSQNGNDSLEKYLMAVQGLEISARECYSETVSLDRNAFVKMMVVDGCFIIKLLHKAHLMAHGIYVSVSDPIFRVPWLLRKLQNDLLLLENQIPYIVLQCLFDVMNISLDGNVSLAYLALEFFSNVVPISHSFTNGRPGLHLLHLLHSNLLPKTKEKELKGALEEFNSPKMIHCITELCQAGMKFEKKEFKKEFKKKEFKKCETHSFLDIKYKKGVITIPPLRVEDFTASLLLNLVALEQCYSYCGIHVTAYITFMDCLINSAKDVKVLRDNNIIDNWLGSDEVVADLFNKLGREVTFTSKEFYLGKVFKEIDDYSKSKRHVWRASLIQNYFYNPWAVISFVAAIILLLLTIAQTILAILSYVHPLS